MGLTPETGVTLATGVRVGLTVVSSTVLADTTVVCIGTTLGELVCEMMGGEVAGVKGGASEGVTTIVDEGVRVAVPVLAPVVCTRTVAVV